MVEKTISERFQSLVAARKAKELTELIEDLHPADVAELLSELSPPEIWFVLRNLGPALRGEIFSHLEAHKQIEVSEHLKREELALLIGDMPPDDRVDLLKRLPEETIERLLPAIAQAEREDIRRLFAYQEGTAGAVMTSEYATIAPNMRVAEAVEKLRREAPDKETIYYIYVVDEQRRLKGLVSLKDLIIASPNTLIKDIMHDDIIFAKVMEDQETAARKIQKYDLIALPVVDDNNSLVGIITHDDALDIITQEHVEDLEKFMAISGSHEVGMYLMTPTWTHFTNRAYWIVMLAALSIISGSIIHFFKDTLAQVMMLVFYMPLLASTGGNTGSQAATVVIRALALNEIKPGDFLKVLSKEFRISFLLAMVLALLTWVKVVFFPMEFGGDHKVFPLGLVGLVISLALGVQVITATLVGAILPLLAARFKIDPTVVASPALATIVDITGLLIYFTTAKLLLGL